MKLPEWLRRDRYVIALRGMESGNVREIPFMTYRTASEALEFALKKNAEDKHGLTQWEVHEIKTKVSYPDGIPRWFTYLSHVVARQRCKRQGHVDHPTKICTHCGEFL